MKAEPFDKLYEAYVCTQPAWSSTILTLVPRNLDLYVIAFLIANYATQCFDQEAICSLVYMFIELRGDFCPQKSLHSSSTQMHISNCVL